MQNLGQQEHFKTITEQERTKKLQEGGRGSQEKDNELIQDKTELGESSSFLSKKRL